MAATAFALGLVVPQPALAQARPWRRWHVDGLAVGAESPNRKVTGTVVSRDETSIQIEAKQKGSGTCVVDARTKFKGDVQPWGEVTLQYEEQGGMQMATTIEVKNAAAKQNH